MKFTKRLLTIALSMGMVMPLCATAYAAPTVTINSATITANATDPNLYDVAVTFTVEENSKQLTLLLTGPNTDGKLDDNDIVHINQFGKNEPDEATIVSGSGTCTFSVTKARIAAAGATVDESAGTTTLSVSMGADDATEATKPKLVTYDDSTPEFILGDVNGDKVVDAQDGQRLYEHLTGLNPLAQGSKGLLAANVNKDEAVDAQDGQRLYEHLTGLNLLK